MNEGEMLACLAHLDQLAELLRDKLAGRRLNEPLPAFPARRRG
jgi:hypothetical protein